MRVRSSSAGDYEIDEFQFGLPSGSTNFLNGYVGEFIVFDESIGDEFENVHAYLAKKWGIQATVDSDNDGVADASDAYPVDATKSFDAPDFLKWWVLSLMPIMQMPLAWQRLRATWYYGWMLRT